MPCCRDKLVEDNLRLVYYLFNKLGRSNATVQYREDILSEGMLGLVKAANSFDEERGIKFATFAVMCVRNQMLMYIRKLNKHMPHEVSLYQPIGIDEEGGELSLADVLEDTSYSMDNHLVMMEIASSIKKLKSKEREILQAAQDGYKQKEIALMQSLTQSYISRKLKNIRKKLTT